MIAAHRHLKDTVICTRKRSLQRAVRVVEDINQRLETRIQPSNIQKQRHAKNRIIDTCQRNLARRAELRRPVQMQPHNTRESKGEPRDEDGGADIENGAEDRNSVGNDKRHDPEQRTNANPQRPRERIVHIDLLGAHLAHDSDVHVLDCCDTDDETGAENRRDQDAVCDLGGDGGRGAERGTGDGVAGEAVDDTCDNDVNDNLEGLLHE